MDNNFRSELKTLMDSGRVLPLATGTSIEQFREMVLDHSIAIVCDSGARHWGRINNFGLGWSSENLKWIARHLRDHPEDMEYARNLMVAAFNKLQEEQIKRSLFYGMKREPL